MDFSKDMVEEILVRLPSKSIMKLKSVCKDWNNIISDPNFRKRYQSRYRNTYPSGFFFHQRRPEFLSTRDPCMPVVGSAKFINTSTIERDDLKIESRDDFGYVVASSKGLLLLSRNPMSYYVYDVLTRKQIQLPKVLKKYGFVALGFICKESDQDHPNNITNGISSYLTFKVYRIGMPPPFDGKTTYRVETYSSETRKWHKSIMTSASPVCLLPQSTAKVIGDKLYWMNWRCKSITAYDPEDPEGCAKLIEFPLVDNYSIDSYGGTQDGCLLHVSVLWDIEVRVLRTELYLDEDVISHSQWSLLHKISFMDLGLCKQDFGTKGCVCFGYPVDLHPQDPKVIFLERATEILAYNIDEKRVETVSSKKEGEEPVYDADTYIFFEFPSWPCLT